MSNPNRKRRKKVVINKINQSKTMAKHISFDTQEEKDAAIAESNAKHAECLALLEEATIV